MHKRGLCRHAGSVRLCACPSRSWILSKWIKISSKLFSLSGSQAILVFPYQTAWQYSDGNVECRWGRQKSGFSANIWLIRMLWTLRRRAAINAIVGRYLAIDRCLLELVLSTDGGPSRLQWCITVTVQVCLRHRKPCTSEYAEKKHNLIYAVVNLTREYN